MPASVAGWVGTKILLWAKGAADQSASWDKAGAHSCTQPAPPHNMPCAAFAWLACSGILPAVLSWQLAWAMQSAEVIAAPAMAMSALAASTLSAGSASRSMSRKRYRAFMAGKIALPGGTGECRMVLCLWMVDLDQSNARSTGINKGHPIDQGHQHDHPMPGICIPATRCRDGTVDFPGKLGLDWNAETILVQIILQ